MRAFGSQRRWTLGTINYTSSLATLNTLNTPDPGGEALPFTTTGSTIWYTSIATIAAANGGSPPLLTAQSLGGTSWNSANNPSAVNASTPPAAHNYVVDNLLYQAYTNYNDISWNGSGGYSACRYVVDSSVTPMVTVQINPVGWTYGYNGSRSTGSVQCPIPSWAVGSNAGGDGEFVVYDTHTGTIWEFWVMASPGNSNGGFGSTWVAETCAIYSTTSGNNNTGVATYGATSSYATPTNLSNTVTESGLSHCAGDIKVFDVASGVPSHCLLFGTPGTFSAPYVWAPANYCTDGSTTISGYPVPMGTRFFFPSTVTKPGGLDAFATYVFNAVQQYGFVICDTSGSAVFYAENNQPWTLAGKPDPWASYNYLDLTLGVLPWTQLQALSPSVS